MKSELFTDSPELTENGHFHINYRESTTPGMRYFHMHSHYEISFILSGNVTCHLNGKVCSGDRPRLLLIPPYVMHYVFPEPDQIYRRLNISFTEKFVSELPSEWLQVRDVFKPSGQFVFPDDEQCERLRKAAVFLLDEKNHSRFRLLLLYFVSNLKDLSGTESVTDERIPSYISESLRYLNENFNEKITVHDVMRRVGISRTAFLTNFKRYMGTTFYQYLLNLRVTNASYLRQNGASTEEAALESGFCDAGGYIRAHKKIYGVTPTGRLGKSRQ